MDAIRANRERELTILTGADARRIKLILAVEAARLARERLKEMRIERIFDHGEAMRGDSSSELGDFTPALDITFTSTNNPSSNIQTHLHTSLPCMMG